MNRNSTGREGYFFRYRLNRTGYNKDGIAKMTQYCAAQVSKNPRTEKEAKDKKEVDKLQLF